MRPKPKVPIEIEILEDCNKSSCSKNNSTSKNSKNQQDFSLITLWFIFTINRLRSISKRLTKLTTNFSVVNTEETEKSLCGNNNPISCPTEQEDSPNNSPPPPHQVKFSCSSSSGMSRRCLCDIIYPILKFSQFTGIIPLSIKHRRNLEGRKIGDCQLIFKWLTPGPICNTIFLILFLFTVPFAYKEIRTRIGFIFHGTDLYAFTFQTYSLVIQSTIILIASRLRKKQFAKGWQELNQVYHAMCDSADSLTRVKLFCFVGCIVIIAEFIIFFSFSILNAVKIIEGGGFPLVIGVFYIQLTTLLPYILSTLFFFICLLIRSHFKQIAEMILTLVDREKHNKCGRLASQIDSMRVLHEQLCNAVKCFEDFFGIQILLTLCNCCFTIVIGAYACIIQGEEISSPHSQEVLTAWGIQLYCAAVFIFLILVAGQLVTNSANTSAPVLNSIPLTDLDEQSQRQVIAFLHKISAFPTKMSAVHITTISTTFLASAATNIITYLLVLMQFKLTIDNKAAVESSLLGTFGNEQDGNSNISSTTAFNNATNDTFI